MKRTYTGTYFIPQEALPKATVRLWLTDGFKWEENENETLIKYTGLKQWSIVDGEEAKQIEAETDGTCIDEYHEYLVLEFVDGTTATFRNSHVDMFIR